MSEAGRMNEERFQINVPYKQAFIPLGRRKHKCVEFWSELPLDIRRVPPAEAPPAYSILDTGTPAWPTSYFVRCFAGALWWPLFDSQGFVSATEFGELADAGEAGTLEKFGLELGHPCPQTPDEYYKDNPYKEIVSCTRDEQWARAQRGAAERFIICGEQILLEAGEPIYFVVPPRPREKYTIVVGASLDRDPDLNSLYNFNRSKRESSARSGLAFGIDEIEDEIARMGDRETDGYASRIVPLMERSRRDAAVLKCTRSFIDLQWLTTRLDHSRSRLLEKSVPCLAVRDLETARSIPLRKVLEQVMSIEDQVGRREFSYEITRATNLMRRLDALSLSDADEAALSRLK